MRMLIIDSQKRTEKKWNRRGFKNQQWREKREKQYEGFIIKKISIEKREKRRIKLRRKNLKFYCRVTLMMNDKQKTMENRLYNKVNFSERY